MTEAEVIDMVMDHRGEVLAATAWEGYLNGGRGFVLTGGQGAGYGPPALARTFPPDLRRRVQRLVRTYQPAKELVVVVLVLLPEGRLLLLAGKRTPTLSPEHAFLKHAGTPDLPPMHMVGLPEPS